jgi:uncharacterized protein YidB (DUF937 family)
MGLLDDVVGAALGGRRGGGALLGLAAHLIQSNGGGLDGLLSQFKGAGLGPLADSWVGTGPNLPISAEQIAQVLGSPQLRQLAQQFGVPADAVSSQLANFLPQVIDRLTPDGRLHDALSGASSADDILKAFLR